MDYGDEVSEYPSITAKDSSVISSWCNQGYPESARFYQGFNSKIRTMI